MQFHKAPKHVPHLHLQINNNEISRVDIFNFLGLQIKDNFEMEYLHLPIFPKIGLA